MSIRPQWPSLVAAIIVLAAAGCGRPEVKSYVVERETEAGPAPAASTAVRLPPAPPSWQSAAAGGARLASFALPAGDGSEAGDMSVIAFPERAGGLLANVNRWRGELGLAPVAAVDLADVVGREQAADYYFHLVDFSEEEDPARRLIGAMLPLDSETWFFKLVGGAALVALEKEAFLSYVRGLEIPPGNQGAAADQFAADSDLGRPTIAYTLPEGWVEKEPTTMRVASFSIAGEGLPDADVSVIPLGGSGGSDVDNIAQWRHQLGLDPISADAMTALIETFEAGGRAFRMVDLVSVGPLPEYGHQARMLVAFLKHGEHRWFFKIVGEDKLVAGERAAFLSFIESVKFETP